MGIHARRKSNPPAMRQTRPRKANKQLHISSLQNFVEIERWESLRRRVQELDSPSPDRMAKSAIF
jgi:hypothetical protein